MLRLVRFPSTLRSGHSLSTSHLSKALVTVGTVAFFTAGALVAHWFAISSKTSA